MRQEEKPVESCQLKNNLDYSFLAGHHTVQVAYHYHVAHGADFNFKWKLELESPFPLASLCTNQNSESWILLTTLS